ncbi:MAG: hypothetical protein H0V26_13305, partial [Solirubrobacterales bacterium]|nr:hypothetical protein [Solirubrobacterales bacterium]
MLVDGDGPTVAAGVMTPIPGPNAQGTETAAPATPASAGPPWDEMTAGGAVEDGATRHLPPPATFTLSVGHDFGARYHIIRVLGTGGMGAVYQAWDKVLEVAVAVKVIRPEATLDPKEADALERRFKRELLLA